MTDGPPPLVVPSEIPWDELSGQALEELLFWLCDALGAHDVQWRTGTGGPSADGGRDVEATFHLVDQDGTLEPRLWWIQAKGRSRTLEPMAVKEAVITASAFDDVDTVVIATNSAFSNPTRDWVAEWRRGHERPRVELWDRHALERMVLAHPSVMARVAPQALSPQGQVQAIAIRFRRLVRLPSEHELRHLWNHREELQLEPLAVVALSSAEIEHGSPEERPWLLNIGEGGLLLSCASGLTALPALVARALELGVDEGPLFRVGDHLVECALARLTADAVRALTD